MKNLALENFKKIGFYNMMCVKISINNQIKKLKIYKK